jgi:hypothetical protein
MKNEVNTLMNKLHKHKQSIFQKTRELIDTYNIFYKDLSPDQKEVLNKYKTTFYWDINLFLYDREEYYRSTYLNIIEMLDSIYKDKQKEKLSLNSIKKELFNKSIEVYEQLIYNISTMDTIFDKVKPIGKKHIVYRGMVLDEKNQYQVKTLKKLYSLKVGETITFQNFISTSLDSSVSFNFSSSKFTEKKDDEICCLLKINIPKSTKLLYLDAEEVGFKGYTDSESISIWSEYEFLLPRSSTLKYKGSFFIENKIPFIAPKNFVKTDYHISKMKVLEFDYVGIDKNREKISADQEIELLRKVPYFQYKFNSYLFKNLLEKKDKRNTKKTNSNKK